MSDSAARRGRCLAALTLAVLLASGCGGPGRATATPLPPDVARPDQPAPVFSNPAQGFRLTPAPEPARAAPAVPATQVPLPDRPTVVAPLDQTPTALAIVRMPLTLLAAPNGSGVRELPTGTTLTITGRSADSAWLAGYTNDGVAGWVFVSAVTLFGSADLKVVDRAVAPDAIATLIAQAMLPVQLPPDLSAMPSAANRTGVVLPAEGLAILGSPLGAPQAESLAVARAAAGQALSVLGRSPDGNWLVVVADRMLGWVPVTALRLDDLTLPLPIVQP